MPLSPQLPDIAVIEQRFRDAGIVPPTDRAAGTYACAARLMATLHWLRLPRSAAAEPAHVFSLAERDGQ